MKVPLLQFLLLLVSETGISIRDDDRPLKAIGEDVIGNAIEVCAVGGLDFAREKRLEGRLDDLVREQEDRLQFRSQALKQADNLWQVLVDASGHVEVQGEAALLGGLPVSHIVVVERRNASGEQDEVALRGLDRDR